MNFDFDALLAEVGKERRSPFRHRISHIGKCVRARTYDGLGLDGEPGEYAARGSLAAAQGTAMGAALEAAAEALGVGKAQVPVEWTRDGVRVTGTADLVTDDAVLDFKRASSSTWTIAGKGGKPEHRAQANSYAFLLHRPNAALVYIHADKPDTLRVVRFLTNQSAAEADLYSAVVVQKWLDTRDASPRPEGKDGFNGECRFCPHARRCNDDGPDAKPYPKETP